MSQEPLWTWDRVEVGQRGATTRVVLTAADMAEYAALARVPLAGFDIGAGAAMPTMMLCYAPLQRDTYASRNGFVAYEQSRSERRQTPFAKCEIRWQRAVRAGDALTAERCVRDKYTRRGSRFVTLGVDVVNQRGEAVGSYDYTCIFDAAPGRGGTHRERPRADPAAAGPVAHVVRETRESIDARDAYRLIGERGVGSNIHTDEDFARRGLFGSTVNSGPATMSYVDRALLAVLDRDAWCARGQLVMRAITPFRCGDEVRFCVAADAAAGDWTVRGLNQRDELVCLAQAGVGA